MALLDMAWRIDPQVRVFTVDTGRLPQETYEMIETVRFRYQTKVEVYFPDALQRQKFYDPPERGFEREIRKRLEYWAKLRKERGGA